MRLSFFFLVIGCFESQKTVIGTPDGEDVSLPDLDSRAEGTSSGSVTGGSGSDGNGSGSGGSGSGDNGSGSEGQARESEAREGNARLTRGG